MRLPAAALVVLALGCGTSTPPPQAQSVSPGDSRVDDLQTTLTEMLERLDVLNERIARLERSREEPPLRASAPEPTPATARPAGETRVVQSVRAPQPERAAAVPSTPLRAADLAEQYRNAIMLLGARRLEEARVAFQHVFDADPSGDLADNALFWIGETYFTAGDYANAISYYRRVSTEYGEQNKSPDAVYKLALAYIRTGDLVLARQTLQEVIARYPYSTSAASARAQLERIKY